MAAVPVHARVRVGGTLYGESQWSVGCAYLLSTGEDPFSAGTLDVQGALESWRDAIKALNGGSVVTGALKTALSGNGTIDWIRCSRIGTDGKETEVALVEMTTPPTGEGAGVHDSQTAVVLSLQTGRPGASNRGRLYWPAISYPLTTGRLNASGGQALATDAAAWLNDVGDAGLSFFTLHLQPAVVSTTRGTARLVTSVRVGNRLDTQRRRAQSQTEVYSSAVVPN